LSSQLLEFKNGNLDDSYRIPTELTTSIINEDGTLTPEYSKFVLQRQSAYASQYYGFLTSGKIFSEPKVRQAFNYAIDRDRIIKYVLKNTGVPAVHGVVPPGMPGYDINNIKGYTFDLEKARQLMTEAGYPGGTGFPEVTLNINEGGGRNLQVMEAIQDMIKKLGVPIKVQTLQFAQHLDNIDAGRSDFYRLGWIADYPDPENFLNLYYGKNVPDNPKDKSPINTFRFKNAKYDELFEQALKISDRTERYKIYQQAEQIAVNEPPVLFIFYDVDLRLVQSFIRGFALDPMHRVNMRYTWLDK
jgi:peptide/nickel transport system substrate-binding protein